MAKVSVPERELWSIDNVAIRKEWPSTNRHLREEAAEGDEGE